SALVAHPSSLIFTPVRAVAVAGFAQRRGQAGGVVGHLQAADDLVQVAVKHAGQVADGQLYAVVGHAVLGEVVGADLLAAVARADLRAALLAGLALAAAQFKVEQPGTQDGHGLVAVLQLGLLVLTGDDQAGGQVGDADGAVGGVDALAAVAGGAVDVDPQVGGVDVHLDLFGFGQHGDGRSGGVDAPARLGDGHALHAMHAA